MICYKLTDKNNMTQNNTLWGEGVEHSKPEMPAPSLCSDSVLHYYRSIPLAFMLNHIHANIDNPVLWESDADKEVVGDYGKAGCFRLKTVKRVKYNFTNEQIRNIRVRFAILCAEAVLYIFEDKYPTDNRPRKAIKAAKEYLKTKSKDAARAAAYAAADAARSAVYAAYAAADADADGNTKIDVEELARLAWVEEFKEG